MCCFKLSLRLNNLSHSSHLNSLSPEMIHKVGFVRTKPKQTPGLTALKFFDVLEGDDEHDPVSQVSTHRVSECAGWGCCCSGRPCCRGSSGTPSCAPWLCVSSRQPCCPERSAGCRSLLPRPPVQSSPLTAVRLCTSGIQHSTQVYDEAPTDAWVMSSMLMLFLRWNSSITISTGSKSGRK